MTRVVPLGPPVAARRPSGVALLGPAFVASVAYVDPGNFATNVQGGARYGYTLLWVVLLANVMAMLVQYLSAKAGIATDRDLPELVREHCPRFVAVGLWLQAEAVVICTDVAEFIGAALGLNLLFGIPPLPAGLITGVLAFVMLAARGHGYRAFETAVTALLCTVFAGFLYQALRIGPSARESLHGLLPRLDGNGSVYVAIGIVGATVMPHAVYLHSALTAGRVPCAGATERIRVLRYARLDVLVALSASGLANLALLAISARLFHRPGLAGPVTLLQAHTEFARLAGGGAALAFALALSASGISSASVGTYAGQVVMAGFVGLRLPLLVRRGITMVPALVVLGSGMSLTGALVLTQVILAFGIPFALLPLVLLTSSRSVMGALVNRRGTTAAAWTCVTVIGGLNVLLIRSLFI